MKDKVVIFIDVISPKNKLQLSTIHQLGLQPFCFVSTIKSASDNYFEKGGQQQQLKNGFVNRLSQVSRFLWQNRGSIHHIEFYPGGRFSFVYLLLGKLLFLKTLCIERGDLLYFRKGGYGAFTRFSMWICYRFAGKLWYRELYMKSMLERIRENGLFFLHNSIETDQAVTRRNTEKDIDFLWLNRVIPQRKSAWFLQVIAKPKFAQTNNYLVGILKDTLFSPDQEYVMEHKPSNLTLEEYSANPARYFERARFFVLPSDVVFANHALLEAMSYGVVPLVSRQLGSELIVDHGINGFIFAHNPEAFEAAMEEAQQLSAESYESYSASAVQKIKDNFSEARYQEGIATLYKMLE